MITSRGKTKTHRERLSSAARQGFLVALDIGTQKIACLIARLEPPKPGEGPSPHLRIIGIGHQPARGIRSGAIIDMERAESAIRAAVAAAERMADVTVQDVIINVSAGLPQSQSFRVEAHLGGREVQASDIQRLITLGRMEAERPGRGTLHANPLGYCIDGTTRIRDPRGMVADRFSANLHAITVQEGVLQNLQLCVERCHLSVVARVFSPYASGLSVLVPDEVELGAIVIDMGAGTSSIAIFQDGGLVFGDTVPLGGAHITADIARGLSTPLTEAERMKTLYGSALVSPQDDRDMIAVPQVGEEDPDSATDVPRSMVTGIIRPRVEEIFELVHDRIAASGIENVSNRRVVLTGGASQLSGAREIAQRLLSKQVRLGRPIRVAGLAESVANGSFATVCGLLIHAQNSPRDLSMNGDLSPVESGRAPWQRFSQWLKENL